MSDSIQKIKFPELVFGFVAPIGADIESTLQAFRDYYVNRSYRVVEIKVTDVFNVLEKYINPLVPLNRLEPRARYFSYIAYGNQLRSVFDDAILASTTIRRIIQRRLRVQRSQDEFSRTVFLLHQFKRKEEIDLLRSVYGRLFFQISIYSRRGARVDYLSRRFASANRAAGTASFRNVAEELIEKDENEVEVTHGQRVASIFHDADFIVSLDALKTVQAQVDRFNELIFGSNSISPTKTEYGMFLAKASALRTLDLSRQVGAAIFSKTGEILALGSNEVPKAGGGTYWADDDYDDRDYMRSVDANHARKRELLTEVIGVIDPSADAKKLLTDKKLLETRFMDVLEYGRAVHAEMGALSDAARLGHSVKEGKLYCTTFPCHMCAKHIVAAGISKVIFLEPYPKSLASDLHSDSITVEGGDRGRYQTFPSVEFEHFYGVSPRRYREIFERTKRKSDEDGTFQKYRNGEAQPIIDIKYPFYADLESYLIDETMTEIGKVVDDDELAAV